MELSEAIEVNESVLAATEDELIEWEGEWLSMMVNGTASLCTELTIALETDAAEAELDSWFEENASWFELLDEEAIDEVNASPTTETDGAEGWSRTETGAIWFEMSEFVAIADEEELEDEEEEETAEECSDFETVAVDVASAEDGPFIKRNRT